VPILCIPCELKALAEATFFHFFFCIARRETSTSTRVTQLQLARLSYPLIQGGQWVDRFSSCTRRGPCLSPERPLIPAPHPRSLERFSSRERNTWVPPRHQHLDTSSFGGAICTNLAPRMVSMPAREAARERSRCGFPSEHMGLTTGWRCLRKQAAAPMKELWATCLFQSAEPALSDDDLEVVCWVPAQVRHDRRFQINLTRHAQLTNTTHLSLHLQATDESLSWGVMPWTYDSFCTSE
jgi:hypothetical protein